MRYRNRLWVSSCVVLGCGGAAASQPSDPLDRGAERPCTVGEASRQHLALPGMAGVYIEPTAFVESADGKILLAGSPIYAFGFDDGGRPQPAEDPEIFGAVLHADGRVQAVPKPMDAPLIQPRALALPDGGWEVVFGIDSTSNFEDSSYRMGARYGRFDGRRWSELEDPLANAASPRFPGSSGLVRNSQGLWWATEAPPGSSFSVRPTILNRNESGWNATRFPDRAAYIELAVGPENGALHAVAVRPDTTKERDGNSLFLHRMEDGAWQPSSKLADSDEGRVHSPILEFSDGEPVVGWWARVDHGETGREARSNRQPSQQGTNHHVLAESIGALELAVVAGHSVWVVDHSLPGGASELRMVQVVSGRNEVLRVLPNPFTGPFNVVATQAGELLVVGPLLEMTAGMLSSLVLRFPIDCAAS